MAKRETVKNLKEVKDLSREVYKDIDNLDEKFDSVKDTLTDITLELADSAKYSKENISNAKKQSDIARAVLNSALKESATNKIKLGVAKLRLRFDRSLSDEQRDRLNDAIEKLDVEREGLDLAGKVNDRLKAGADAVKAKVAAALSLSAIFGTLVSIATSFSSRIDSVGKSFGVLASDQSFISNLTAAEMEVASIGLGIDDVTSTVTGLTSNFGLTLDKAAELAPTILKSKVALGISNDEAVNLFGTLTEVLGLGEDTTASFIDSTFALAKQARVAPAAVFRDIAGSADAVAKFTDSTGDNIARAAIQAQRLGVGLDTSAKIAESLLDFQSSVQAELQASTLIGRRLNFQRARELALNNDIAGAVENVVAQLGSEEELNSLNSIQRESIAKSIGVSSVELAKVVGKQKELNSLADVFADGPSIVETLKASDSLSNLTSIINKVKELGVTVVNTLGPDIELFIGELLTKIEGLVEEGGLMVKLTNFAKSIGEGFKAMASNLELVGKIAVGLASALTVAAIAATIASGGTNIAAGAAIAASAGVAGFLGFQAFHDLPQGQMAVATAQDSPVNMTQGEAVARVEDIQQKDVHVHVDNQGVIDAINNIDFAVEIDRNKLQVLLNGGAGI